MNAKAALILHLLNGETLNVKNVFKNIGYTNAAREISRMVETPFNVVCHRERKEGTSRYGQPVTWFDYTLPKTPQNADGILKMREYLAEHYKSQPCAPEAAKNGIRQSLVNFGD